HVVIVANCISQARIIFDEAAKFVAQSDKLSEHVWVREHIKTLEYKKKFGKLEVLSADKRAKMGKNLSAVFFDEPADFGVYQRELYDALISSQSNRRQPIFATLSSAGVALNSLGKELYDVAKAVKDGTKEDLQLLPVIFEAAPDDPWDDLATAKKANPSFGL